MMPTERDLCDTLGRIYQAELIKYRECPKAYWRAMQKAREQYLSVRITMMVKYSAPMPVQGLGESA